MTDDRDPVHDDLVEASAMLDRIKARLDRVPTKFGLVLITTAAALIGWIVFALIAWAVAA